MKIRNSLKSLRGRHRDNQLVRRKGRVYVINKTQKRYKARQGAGRVAAGRSVPRFYELTAHAGIPKDPGMRLFVLVLIASFSLVGPLTHAQDSRRPAIGRGESRQPAAREPSRAVTMDSLFERLAKAENEREAQGISGLIERRWARSGSDTADLLLNRASEAVEKKNLDLAVELLDRVTTLRPDWASAWYTRATVFYQLDDPIAAMADLNRALKLEPRHYAAWAGLGQIFLATDDKARALQAFRQALKINPQIPSLQPIVDKLGHEIDGLDL